MYVFPLPAMTMNYFQGDNFHSIRSKDKCSMFCMYFYHYYRRRYYSPIHATYLAMCVHVCARLCVCMGDKDSKSQDYCFNSTFKSGVRSGRYMPGFSKLLIASVIELVQRCDLIIKTHLEFLLNNYQMAQITQ